ncbi:hypothetical protein [Shimia sp.]|uniref:hypothetical protein n=1 Tax=Shimia sp. TaxID=1954381 RepID=UPI003B8D11A8
MAGAAIGAGAALITVVSLDYSVRNNVQDNWAILLAAAATITAGVGGGLLAWKSAQRQVDNQNRLAEEENAKSLLAARAALPAVLANLYEKTSTSLKLLVSCSQRCEAPVDRYTEFQSTEIEDAEMAILKECIKYSDVETSQWLSLIISHTQFNRSRLKSIVKQPRQRRTDQTANDAIEWYLLIAMIDHMWDFARTGKCANDQLEKNKPAADRLKTSLFHTDLGPRCEGWEEAQSQMVARIERNGGWSSSAFLNRL